MIAGPVKKRLFQVQLKNFFHSQEKLTLDSNEVLCSIHKWLLRFFLQYDTKFGLTKEIFQRSTNYEMAVSFF